MFSWQRYQPHRVFSKSVGVWKYMRDCDKEIRERTGDHLGSDKEVHGNIYVTTVTAIKKQWQNLRDNCGCGKDVHGRMYMTTLAVTKKSMAEFT